MARYYLFDMHAANIADARLVDVVSTSPGSPEIRIDGLTPVRIPDGVEITNPTSLEDLLDQKRAGIQALYPGFRYIAWDDLLEPSGISLAPIEDAPGSAGQTTIGSRGTIGGAIETVDQVLAEATVTQCVVKFEVYAIRYANPRGGRVARYYVEEPDIGLTQVWASTSGTMANTLVTEGAITTFGAGQVGNTLRLRFALSVIVPPVPRIGYWAVLY